MQRVSWAEPAGTAGEELGLVLLQEAGGRDAQGFGDPNDVDEGGIPEPALDAADVGAVELSLLGEALLRPALVLPERRDTAPESSDLAVGPAHAANVSRG